MRVGSFVFSAALAAAPCIARAQSTLPPTTAPSSAATPGVDPNRPWTAPPLARPPSRAAIDEARHRFERAVELADNGNFQGALDEFTRAYVLTRNPRVLYNISASHEALGHVIDALDALHAFTNQAPADILRRQQAEIAAAEQRLQNRIGTLVVESPTPDVEMRLDGVQVPAADLRAGLRLEAGHHHLAVTASGFAPREEDVIVRGNAAMRQTIDLTRLTARLAVESNLQGATVTVDDTVIGTTPLTSPIVVPQGPHHVRVVRPGYATYESDVNVGSEGARVSAQLGWADPIPNDVAAHLVVQLPETGAHATLDGRGIGLEGGDRLPPGNHRLRVERRDRLPLERSVRLTAGHQASVDVVLVPTLDARQDRVARTRLYGWIIGGAGALLFLGFGTWFVINEAIGAPATQIEFRIASASVAGLGFAALAAGAAVLVAAPRMDTGPREPTFRFRAGLGTVSAEWRF
jgi:hypothetical protein